jgi:hypothetical protein
VDNLVLFLTLEEMLSVTFSRMFAKDLSYMAFTMLRDILSIPPFFKAFIIKFYQYLAKDFFYIKKICLYATLYLYICVTFINFIMVYEPFNMPNSVCKYFVEKYASMFIRDWYVILILCCVRIWFWNRCDTGIIDPGGVTSLSSLSIGVLF